MITVADLSIAVQSAVALLGLTVGWLILRPNYRCDLFRQEMFKLRDEMFDYARSGAIPFNHPAYTELRVLMNHIIRFAHRITFGQLLVILICDKLFSDAPQHAGAEWTAEWEKAIRSIADPEVRAAMRQFHSRMAWLITRHLMLGSIPTITLSALAFFVGILVAFFHGARTALHRWSGLRGLATAAVQRSGDLTIRTDWIEEKALLCA